MGTPRPTGFGFGDGAHVWYTAALLWQVQHGIIEGSLLCSLRPSSPGLLTIYYHDSGCIIKKTIHICVNSIVYYVYILVAYICSCNTLCIYVYICIYIYMYMYMYIYIYICICICKYIYIYIFIYVYVSVYIYIYTYMYTNTCVCIHTPGKFNVT